MGRRLGSQGRPPSRSTCPHSSCPVAKAPNGVLNKVGLKLWGDCRAGAMRFHRRVEMTGFGR